MSTDERWNERDGSVRTTRDDGAPAAPAPATEQSASGEKPINDDRDRYLASPQQTTEARRSNPERGARASAESRAGDDDWRRATQPVASPWPAAESPPRRQTFAGKGPKGYTRSDQRLLEEICERLTADHELDASELSVSVRDSEVTLEGSVRDRHSKHLAEDLAAAVSGVREVHNRLRAQKGLFGEIGERFGHREG